MCLNFGKFKIVTKSLETLQQSSNRSSLLKKLSLNSPAYTLMLLPSLLDFTYIAFKDLVCGIFVDLESAHIVS